MQKIKQDISLGDNIRKYRKMAGMTQESVVTQLQLSGSDISRSIYMAECRKLPKCEEDERNLSDTSNNTKESIDRMNALKAVTINCAFACKEENRMGSIKKGKIANFAILDKDLLNDSAEEMIKAKTIATIIDGEVVYKA